MLRKVTHCAGRMTVLVTAMYLRMLEVYHFCAQVTSMLDQGKPNESIKEI